MSRFSGLLVLTFLATAATGVAAQEPPPAVAPAPAASPPVALPPVAPPAAPAPAPTDIGVQVETLAAPDAFTTPGRDTGLPASLWRGASLKTVQAVLPLLAARPLSPAAGALARRVLATGAQGPKGADDAALTGLRATALLAQGDAKAAAAILARAPGVDRSPELARAAAEGALLSGDDARACRVADGLTSGRGDIYWLRLRAYCQAVGGQGDQAQLTFELAQAQAKDAIFARLMSAKLAGAGNPGPAALRNGLDYALSRDLGLDLGAAKASPAVAAALAGVDPTDPTFDLAAIPPDLAPLAEAAASGRPLREGDFIAVMTAGQSADPKARARAQAAILLELALESEGSPESREVMASLSVAEGRAPVGRNLALDAVANRKLMGEAAMLVLWTCAEAGPTGLAVGDRVRIVHALHAVGLETDARAFALEGLMALK